MYKIRFLFLNLQRMGKVIRAFCWHQKFFPKGLYALAPGLYACIKSLKMCINSDFEEIILKLATYGQRENAFPLSSKFCHQCVVCPCQGLYTCGKTWKSDFKEIVLKLATNGQSDKGFLLTSRFCPQGIFCPCPGAMYMYKSIKIYQDQVSGEHWSSGLFSFYLKKKFQYANSVDPDLHCLPSPIYGTLGTSG